MVQMCQLGYACKAALYNVSDDKLNKLFANIRKGINKCDGSWEGSPNADTVFLPIHRDQIKFLSKLITLEFNQMGLGGKSNDANRSGGKRDNKNNNAMKKPIDENKEKN